jgi:hypothetical protein
MSISKSTPSITRRSEAIRAAVREQYLDQRPGAGRVATLAAGGVPIPLVGVGERAARLRLRQRRRTGQRPGLDREDLEVVVQGEDLDVLAPARSCPATNRPPSRTSTVVADSRTGRRRPA